MSYIDPCETAPDLDCAGGTDCICDEHPDTCDTCHDTGGVTVHQGQFAIELPCPDCPRGDEQ